MKTFVPNYYSRFFCIADGCKHSCCIGWEIDIDERTYEFYQNVGGELGKRLCEGISNDGGQPHFILDENERCPFLDKSGLCDIITQCGEEYLCQICADHPRFRNFFSDRTEIGLGLCCEEAVRLILGSAEPFSLVLTEDDGSGELSDDEEKELLEIRERAFDIVRNRELSFEMRVEQLLDEFSVRLPELAPACWSEMFSALERLDSKWDECLSKLSRFNALATTIDDETAAENLMCAFLFRHMPSALDDGDVKSKIAFAVLSCRVIFTLSDVMPVSEAVRMYSSEIEYSDENLNAVFDYLS